MTHVDDVGAAAGDGARSAHTYSFRPSLLAAAHEFTLSDGGMHWSLAGREGLIPYASIRRVRLSFRPINLATYRFLMEIWSDDMPKLQISSTSWRTVVEQARQDAPYAAFVADLHKRLAGIGSTAEFVSGRPPLVYWPGLVVFVALALALAYITARSLQQASWTAFALIGGVLLLLLWQIGNMFRRNRPGRYRADAIPRHALPGG